MLKDNFWYRKNVFITGCTGFLGSWLTIELVNRKANVIGLIRDWVPHSNLNWSGFHSKIITVRGCVEDYFLLERILNEYEVDTVFDLAAQTIVSISNNNPISTFESNIKGTWNLLEACRRNSKRVERIILASSDKAYGEHKKLPYDESAALRGSHPYDVSKSCADLIAQAYFSTYRTPVCITRCGNFYGGGDLNFNRIVPGTIRSVIDNQRPIIRSDGLYVRDYFYIKDAVYAYLLLAEKMNELEIYGEAFNFSNENQIDVIRITNMILRLMRREDLKPIILNEVSNEIRHQYLSATKAKNIFGWRPKYTIEEGLQETIEWYREFFSK